MGHGYEGGEKLIMKLLLKSSSTGLVFMSCAASGKDIKWYSDMMRRESRRRGGRVGGDEG